MYGPLLLVHSSLRWLVVAGIVIVLARSYAGLFGDRRFTSGDRRMVGIATGMAHLQLVVGLLLYMSSPIVAAFWDDPGREAGVLQALFFGLLHMGGMLTAIVLMSVGAGRSRRGVDDRERFRAIVLFWSIATLVILIFIPWPFSPLATRPLLRTA